MSGWRTLEIGREAWRSTTVSMVRTVATVVLAGGLAFGLTWMDLAATDDALAFQREFARLGGFVAVASDSQDQVPVGRCVSLAQRVGVIAAGALSAGNTVQLHEAPGTMFQTGTATPGAILLWAADPPSHADLAVGTVLGRAAADELGLATGMLLGADGLDTAQTVGAVIDTEARNPFVSRWIIQVGPPAGTASQCWVEFAPGTLETGLQVLAATFAELQPDLEVRRWIRLDDFARDPVADLAGRPEKDAWIPIGVAIALLVWLTVWARTSEIGLYRAVGTSNPALWLLGQLEVAYVLVPAMVSGYLWAAVAHAAVAEVQPGMDQLLVAARGAGSALLLALITAPLAWLWAGRGQIAAQLKDR
ncbi:MAG: hypothetical protein QY307_02295 [Acidimicrobiia bacterium]|nr:MAG: hypothetical protein QY307_02295 [Acidimicrobiia bacterium]